MSRKADRLSQLARRRGSPGGARTPAPDPGRSTRPGDLSRWIPGMEVRTPRGRHWRHERRMALADLASAREVLTANGLWEREAQEIHEADATRLEQLLFLDLETCGFAGTPLFLAGVLWLENETGVLVQLLARTYAEEASVVEGLLELMAPRPLLVTFNGKAYDLPFLRDRAIRFGLTVPPPPGHLDLLHAARRRWKDVLPDCRLTTLESRLTGRHRGGDVPGREVPDRYHRFVRERRIEGLIPVLRHNFFDLTTLVTILASLVQSEFS